MRASIRRRQRGGGASQLIPSCVLQCTDVVLTAEVGDGVPATKGRGAAKASLPHSRGQGDADFSPYCVVDRGLHQFH